MSKPPPPSLDDYDAIEAAVRETERGRWFLEQFARRNRAADTAQILGALAALETRIQAAPALPSLGPCESRFAEEPAWTSSACEGGAEVRTTPSLMLAPPADEPPAPEVTELVVVPPLEDAHAGLDLAAGGLLDVDAFRETDAFEVIDSDDAIADEPGESSFSATRMRVEAELADLAGLRASLSIADSAPQPIAPRPKRSPPRQAPLLESLSEAEKALLFA